MRIEKAMLHGVPVLRVIGDIDHHSGDSFLRAAEEALGPDGARILVDLEACPYLDSGGISVLISILKRIKVQSGWMGVVSPCDNVRRLLDIVAFSADPASRLFPDLSAAEGQLRGDLAIG